ncbi:hypothetical protein K435DRAFT_819612 [Dendrothele bispora CBS 962.96]|uniref:Uncharacterized protein n=1 Tax=Dendrothele bispora (strain CBS 962.96) TaxID=1314807 RepID=A0A4S8M2E5_DENBC|nr:hypothetical protein K435DRAFT_819612 [Dendrothele bispora CBS 962.96]
MKTWNTPVYAFFDPVLSIEYVNRRKCQVFKCSGTSCRKQIRRFQDTGDANATKGLIKDLKGTDARKAVSTYLKQGTITAAFKRENKGVVTYSHRQHTRTETRAEIVRWVAESSRPYAIVKDRGFQCLMKTGRPGYYLPHPTTVSRDVKMVFAKTRRRVAQWLQNYDGKLNFATDAWTSPNHRAYIAVSIHLEREGVPLSFLLDFIEVAKVYFTSEKCVLHATDQMS